MMMTGFSDLNTTYSFECGYKEKGLFSFFFFKKKGSAQTTSEKAFELALNQLCIRLRREPMEKYRKTNYSLHLVDKEKLATADGCFG